MRYSGSRLVREMSASVSEKEVKYHGPGKEESGWKNCVYTMRYVRAPNISMGTSRPICGSVNAVSSMLPQW